jgi:hypothetical protein
MVLSAVLWPINMAKTTKTTNSTLDRGGPLVDAELAKTEKEGPLVFEVAAVPVGESDRDSVVPVPAAEGARGVCEPASEVPAAGLPLADPDSPAEVTSTAVVPAGATILVLEGGGFAFISGP